MSTESKLTIGQLIISQFVQTLYLLIIVAYIYIVFFGVPVMMAKLIQFILNLFFRRKLTQIKIGHLRISFMALQIHMTNLSFVNSKISVQVGDVLIKFHGLRSVTLKTLAQVQDYMSDNIQKPVKNIAAPTSLISITISGLDVHLFSREPQQQQEKTPDQVPVKPAQFPMVFKFLSAIQLSIKGFRVILGNHITRQLIRVDIPEYNGFVSALQCDNTQDVYKLVVDGVCQNKEKVDDQFKNFQVSIVENNKFGSKEGPQTTFNYETPKPLLIPIISAKYSRFTVSIDKGGLIQDQVTKSYSDAQAPMFHIEVRFSECGLCFSPWHLKEIFNTIDFFLPFSFDDREIFQSNLQNVRIAPAIVFGAYFDNAVPIRMFSRNTDLDYNPMEDDFILKSKKIYQANIDRIRLEKELQKLEAQVGKVQKKRKDIEEKKEHYYSFFKIDYQKMSNEMMQQEPSVPTLNDYSQRIEYFDILLAAKTNIMFRHQGKLLQLSTKLVPAQKTLLVRSPSVILFSSVTNQRILIADDFMFLFTSKQKEPKILSKVYQDFCFGARNLRFDFNKTTLFHILRLVSDITSDDLVKAYYIKAGFNIMKNHFDKRLCHCKVDRNIIFNVINYEINVILSKDNVVSQLQHVEKVQSCYNFIYNEIVFIKNILVDESFNYQSKFYCKQLGYVTGILENSQMLPPKLKSVVEDQTRKIPQVSLMTSLDKFDIEYFDVFWSDFRRFITNNCNTDKEFEDEISSICQLRKYQQPVNSFLVLHGSQMRFSIEMIRNSINDDVSNMLPKCNSYQQLTKLLDNSKNHYCYFNTSIQFNFQNLGVSIRPAVNSILFKHRDSSITKDLQVGNIDYVSFVLCLENSNVATVQNNMKIVLDLKNPILIYNSLVLDVIIRFVFNFLLEQSCYLHCDDYYQHNFQNNVSVLLKNKAAVKKANREILSLDSREPEQSHHDTETSSQDYSKLQFSKIIGQLVSQLKLNGTQFSLHVNHAQVLLPLYPFNELPQLCQEQMFNPHLFFYGKCEEVVVNFVSDNNLMSVNVITSPIKFYNQETQLQNRQLSDIQKMKQTKTTQTSLRDKQSFYQNYFEKRNEILEYFEKEPVIVVSYVHVKVQNQVSQHYEKLSYIIPVNVQVGSLKLKSEVQLVNQVVQILNAELFLLNNNVIDQFPDIQEFQTFNMMKKYLMQSSIKAQKPKNDKIGCDYLYSFQFRGASIKFIGVQVGCIDLLLFTDSISQRRVDFIVQVKQVSVQVCINYLREGQLYLNLQVPALFCEMKNQTDNQYSIQTFSCSTGFSLQIKNNRYVEQYKYMQELLELKKIRFTKQYDQCPFIDKPNNSSLYSFSEFLSNSYESQQFDSSFKNINFDDSPDIIEYLSQPYLVFNPTIYNDDFCHVAMKQQLSRFDFVSPYSQFIQGSLFYEAKTNQILLQPLEEQLVINFDLNHFSVDYFPQSMYSIHQFLSKINFYQLDTIEDINYLFYNNSITDDASFQLEQLLQQNIQVVSSHQSSNFLQKNDETLDFENTQQQHSYLQIENLSISDQIKTKKNEIKLKDEEITNGFIKGRHVKSQSVFMIADKLQIENIRKLTEFQFSLKTIRISIKEYTQDNVQSQISLVHFFIDEVDLSSNQKEKVREYPLICSKILKSRYPFLSEKSFRQQLKQTKDFCLKIKNSYLFTPNKYNAINPDMLNNFDIPQFITSVDSVIALELIEAHFSFLSNLGKQIIQQLIVDLPVVNLIALPQSLGCYFQAFQNTKKLYQQTLSQFFNKLKYTKKLFHSIQCLVLGQNFRTGYLSESKYNILFNNKHRQIISKYVYYCKENKQDIFDQIMSQVDITVNHPPDFVSQVDYGIKALIKQVQGNYGEVSKEQLQKPNLILRCNIQGANLYFYSHDCQRFSTGNLGVFNLLISLKNSNIQTEKNIINIVCSHQDFHVVFNESILDYIFFKQYVDKVAGLVLYQVDLGFENEIIQDQTDLLLSNGVQERMISEIKKLDDLTNVSLGKKLMIFLNNIDLKVVTRLKDYDAKFDDMLKFDLTVNNIYTTFLSVQVVDSQFARYILNLEIPSINLSISSKKQQIFNAIISQNQFVFRGQEEKFLLDSQDTYDVSTMLLCQISSINIAINDIDSNYCDIVEFLQNFTNLLSIKSQQKQHAKLKSSKDNQPSILQFYPKIDFLFKIQNLEINLDFQDFQSVLLCFNDFTIMISSFGKQQSVVFPVQLFLGCYKSQLTAGNSPAVDIPSIYLYSSFYGASFQLLSSMFIQFKKITITQQLIFYFYSFVLRFINNRLFKFNIPQLINNTMRQLQQLSNNKRYRSQKGGIRYSWFACCSPIILQINLQDIHITTLLQQQLFIFSNMTISEKCGTSFGKLVKTIQYLVPFGTRCYYQSNLLSILLSKQEIDFEPKAFDISQMQMNKNQQFLTYDGAILFAYVQLHVLIQATVSDCYQKYQVKVLSLDSHICAQVVQAISFVSTFVKILAQHKKKIQNKYESLLYQIKQVQNSKYEVDNIKNSQLILVLNIDQLKLCMHSLYDDLIELDVAGYELKCVRASIDKINQLDSRNCQQFLLSQREQTIDVNFSNNMEENQKLTIIFNFDASMLIDAKQQTSHINIKFNVYLIRLKLNDFIVRSITQWISSFEQTTFIPMNINVSFDTNTSKVSESESEVLQFQERVINIVFPYEKFISFNGQIKNIGMQFDYDKKQIVLAFPSLITNLAIKIIREQSQDYYSNEETYQLYTQFMKHNKIFILSVPCKLNKYIKVSILIQKYVLTLPQDFINFIQYSVQKGVQQEQIVKGQQLVMQQSLIQLSTEGFDQELKQFLYSLNTQAAIVEQLQLILNLESLQILFAPQLDEHTEELPTIIVLLSNFKYVVSYADTLVHSILLKQFSFYMAKAQVVDYAIICSKTIQFPDFVFPLNINIENMNLIIQRQHKVIKIDTLVIQFSTLALSHISYLSTKWKEQYDDIINKFEQIYDKFYKIIQSQNSLDIVSQFQDSSSITFILSKFKLLLFQNQYYGLNMKNKINSDDNVVLLTILQLQKFQRENYKLLLLIDVQNLNSKYALLVDYQLQINQCKQLNFILPELILHFTHQMILDFGIKQLMVTYQSGKDESQQHNWIYSMNVQLNEIFVKLFNVVEIADIRVIKQNVSYQRVDNSEKQYKTSNLEYNIDFCQVFVGLQLPSLLSKAIFSIWNDFILKWGDGISLYKLQEQKFVEQQNSLQQKIESLMQDLQYQAPFQNQDTFIKQQPIKEVNESCYLKVFNHGMPFIIFFEVSKTNIIVGQSSLADCYLLCLNVDVLRSTLFFKQKKNKQSVVVKSFNTIQTLIQDQPVGFHIINELGVQTKLITVDFIEKQVDVDMSELDSYLTNNQKIPYLHSLLKSKKLKMQQGINLTNSTWKINIDSNMFSKVQSLLIHNTFKIETQLGQFMTNNIFKLIDFLNIILRDFTSLLNTITVQQSQKMIQEKQKQVEVKLLKQRQDGKKVVNYQFLDTEMLILMSSEFTDLSKLLPNIDMFGKGTGLLESFVRKYFLTNTQLEALLEALAVSIFDIASVLEKLSLIFK